MILVTGAKGQLGSALMKRFGLLKIDAVGIDIDDCDITDKKQVRVVLDRVSPDAVIHCAAYTAVDKAESEYDRCFEVNVQGTCNFAEECADRDIKLLYTGTDYVFSGDDDNAPYETDAEVNPQSVYGKSKLAGEIAVRELCKKHFIVRISWVFGNGNNFIKTMLRLSKERDCISVVADQIGSPTYTEDLAVLLCDMILTEKYGTYHATNEGFCTWFELACKALQVAGSETPVLPIVTEDYPTAAKRPPDSRLSKRSLDEAGFSRLPHWEDAVERYIKSLM